MDSSSRRSSQGSERSKHNNDNNDNNITSPSDGNNEHSPEQKRYYRHTFMRVRVKREYGLQTYTCVDKHIYTLPIPFW